MQMLDVSVKCVTMHSVVFCIVLSFVMFVLYAIVDHIMDAFFSIGLVTALCVERNVPLFPQLN